MLLIVAYLCKQDGDIGVLIVDCAFLGFNPLATVFHLSEEIGKPVAKLLKGQGLELGVERVCVDLCVRF